jgi:hypothetical protein
MMTCVRSMWTKIKFTLGYRPPTTPEPSLPKSNGVVSEKKRADDRPPHNALISCTHIKRSHQFEDTACVRWRSIFFHPIVRAWTKLLFLREYYNDFDFYINISLISHFMKNHKFMLK